jgi:hypothetical protein
MVSIFGALNGCLLEGLAHPKAHAYDECSPEDVLFFRQAD